MKIIKIDNNEEPAMIHFELDDGTEAIYSVEDIIVEDDTVLIKAQPTLSPIK